MPDATNEQKIRVLTGGPYRVEGGVPILDHTGAGRRLLLPDVLSDDHRDGRGRVVTLHPPA